METMLGVVFSVVLHEVSTDYSFVLVVFQVHSRKCLLWLILLIWFHYVNVIEGLKVVEVVVL